jgi:hypothetical protein
VTTFVILSRDESGYWRQADGYFEAHSAESAVRAYGDKNGGVYVAVPVRSWRPLKVEVETRKQVTVAPVSEKEQQ